MTTPKKRRLWKKAVGLVVLLLTGAGIFPAAGEEAGRRRRGSPTEAQKAELLKTRETVWRSWFAGDQARLRELLPEEVLAINNGEEASQHLDAILAGARNFGARGGRFINPGWHMDSGR